MNVFRAEVDLSTLPRVGPDSLSFQADMCTATGDILVLLKESVYYSNNGGVATGLLYFGTESGDNTAKMAGYYVGNLVFGTAEKQTAPNSSARGYLVRSGESLWTRVTMSHPNETPPARTIIVVYHYLPVTAGAMLEAA